MKHTLADLFFFHLPKGFRAFYFALPLFLLAAVNLAFYLPANPDAFLIVRLLFGAVIEELVFRGLLYSLLSKKLSPVTAAILSSVLFAVLHLLNLLNGFTGAQFQETLLQIAVAFTVGCAFCAYVYRFSSILFPILAHLAINFTSLYCAFRHVPVYLLSFALTGLMYLIYAYIFFYHNPRRTH